MVKTVVHTLLVLNPLQLLSVTITFYSFLQLCYENNAFTKFGEGQLQREFGNHMSRGSMLDDLK